MIARAKQFIMIIMLLLPFAGLAYLLLLALFGFAILSNENFPAVTPESLYLHQTRCGEVFPWGVLANVTRMSPRGFVIDEDDNPIAGVEITISGIAALDDDYREAFIEGVLALASARTEDECTAWLDYFDIYDFEQIVMVSDEEGYFNFADASSRLEPTFEAYPHDFIMFRPSVVADLPVTLQFDECGEQIRGDATMWQFQHSNKDEFLDGELIPANIRYLCSDAEETDEP